MEDKSSDLMDGLSDLMVEEISFLLREDGPNHENDDDDDELPSSEHSFP
jgi:hypothetical protein